MRQKLILLLLVTVLECSSNFQVHTELNANWQETSIIAEISEYLAVEDERFFWSFVEELEKLQDVPMDTPKEQYDAGMRIAEHLLHPSKIGLFRLAMSLRVMSPRVEAYRRLSSGGGNSHGKGHYYEHDDVGAELKLEDFATEIEIYDFDHIYPVKSDASRTIVIYGSLTSKSFLRMVRKAKSIVNSNEDVRLVVRHFSTSASTFSTSFNRLVSLSGYGVELAIKNTEYKAVDSNPQEDPADLHGLNFKVLRQKHENLGEELESLREHLEKLDEIVPLKSWQLNNLGLKACQKIAAEQNIEAMEQMIQDFPLHARVVSHVELQEKFGESVKEFQKKMEVKGVENGENVLAINGRVVKVENDQHIDIFSLLETVKQEQNAVEAISRIGFPPSTDMSQVLTSVDLSPIDSASFAFDYREALPVYLNDLETTFARFKALPLMLQPFPPGKIRPISRNIFNLILFSDPFQPNDKLFSKIRELVDSGIYIRFGVVPVFDERKFGMSIEKAVETINICNEKKTLWPSKGGLLNALRRGNRFFKTIGRIQQPLLLLNGYVLDVTEESFDEVLTTAIGVQTIRLQMALYQEEVNDDVKISDWWLEEETNSDIVERANQRITDAFEEKKFVKIEDTFELNYFSKTPIIQKNTPVTTWIVADFNTEKEREFAVDILKSIGETDKIALIPNHKESCNPGGSPVLKLEEVDDLKQLISELRNGKLICSNSPIQLVELGEMAIVSNGVIIGPLDPSDFLPEDMEFLNRLWKGKKAIETSDLLNRLIDKDVSVKFYSEMAKIQKPSLKRQSFREFLAGDDQKNSVIFPPSDPMSPSISVTWIANPLSRMAQQIVSLVKLIHKTTNSKVEIIFNPQHTISEMPVKRFYRFVATDQLTFGSDGSVEKQAALFASLPQKQLLTLSVQTNEAWMIELKKAVHDLDNIMLETMGDVEGVFQMQHLLVEGQASTPAGAPAHGVQLELTLGEKVHDTIVMLNLGYFQLKAEPGLWNLNLRNGSSAEKHRILKAESSLLVDSFNGKWTKLVVEEKEKPKEKSQIEKFVDSAKHFFSFEPQEEDVINVFSLASGHLYERFLRIMMVSVMKNTYTKKVKFWLLKNYLSPKFKESIPVLAEHYGFEYELVEYKWPKWLHQQTEKQRVMWGYKILFLDVLFPLNVDKIIFVDADQVVRADLQELMDLNLNGAPYGYAPFCESRSEMDGFRFWKSGYWNQHLMGRRYHISALYVVDLKKFRELFAGDRLRGRYAMLSTDPKSLSNLDQDLPNNMIHEVPIKTLPQEWLWCETWCDERSKSHAKTIDLCNNPLTKEPKLNSAQRIIGEWKELDEEIAEVLKGESKKERIKTEL